MQLSGIRSIATNAGYLIAARVLTNLVRAVYVVVLARYLGPELYGLFAYGQSWYLAFLPLPLLGLGFILGREAGRDREHGGRLAQRTLTLQLVATVAATVACATAGWIADPEPAARPLLLIFALALAGRSVSIWVQQAFAAFEQSKYSLHQERLFRPAEVAIGVAVLMAGGGVVGVAAVHAALWWLQAVRGVVLVHRRITPLRLVWEWPTLARLVAQGLPIGLHTIFVAWLLQGTLVLYRHAAGLGAGLGADGGGDLGQLALAIQALLLLNVAAVSVSLSALPVLSRAVARADGNDRRFAEEALRVGLIAGAMAGMAATTAGPWVVQTLLGERYVLAGELLGPAMWLLTAFAWGNGLSAVLIARSASRGLLLSGLAGAVTLTLSLPPLVSNAGALGAVLATGAGAGVWALSSVVFVVRSGKLDLLRGVVWPGAAVLLAVGIYVTLRSVGDWSALLGGGAILTAALFVLGILAPPARLLAGAAALMRGRPPR